MVIAELKFVLLARVPTVPSCQILISVYNIIIIVITIVERNTGKYYEFIAKYCYECEARVTILGYRMANL